MEKVVRDQFGKFVRALVSKGEPITQYKQWLLQQKIRVSAVRFCPRLPYFKNLTAMWSFFHGETTI